MAGMIDISALDFAKGGGLVTVVAQDAATGAVLMVAHGSRESMEATVRTGEMHYQSRTRGLWHKGATSGSTQKVVSLEVDCDGDAVLARVDPRGPACHTGRYSCFGEAAPDALGNLDRVVAARKAAPEVAERRSYTQRLLSDRNLRLKKLGEESAELVAACADSSAERAVEEAADLVYHVAVALGAVGASLDDVRRVLWARAASGTGTP
jgi:phosphoribosyl-ATP pyrophosphohydrolase/phosphoribosyl-AMP cyclohydrolase